MKAVMLSIQPKWCELIASGKKTVEVRKTHPKLETPFKCYIYQTKKAWLYDIYSVIAGWQRKIIGEFVCDDITYLGNIATDPWKYLSGSTHEYHKKLVTEKACLTENEMLYYGAQYAWHISDLVIYDKPKELSEFCVTDNSAIQFCKHREIAGQPEYKTAHNGWIKGSYICNANGEPDWCTKCKVKPITRPPQSWCYVEELR